MALFNLRTGAAANRNVEVAKLQEIFGQQDADIFSKELSAAYVGCESEAKLTQTEIDGFEQHCSGVVGIIGQAMSVSDLGLESASRAALALGDLDAVAQAVSGLGLEAFTKTALGNFKAETVAANAMIAEKRTILDTLYPVVEVGAKFAGVEITLQRFVRVGNVTNPGDGKTVSWDRTHIANGYRDINALRGNTNALIPIVVSGSTEEYFVDPALAPYSTVEGTKLKTGVIAPLTEEINLLGLARIPGASSVSQHTYNDRIDEGGYVKTLYVRVGEDKSGSGGDDERTLLPITLSSLNTAQFIKGANVGESNAVVSDISSKSLAISLNATIAAKHPALKALADLEYTRIHVGIQLKHTLNLHSGNLEQLASGVKVTGVFKANDEKNYVGDAGVDAEIAKLAPVFGGVDFGLTISSKTIRLQGTRVDDQSLPYTFQTTAQSPFTADRAIDETDVQSALETMTASYVIEREAAAVRHCLEQIEMLNAQYGDSDVAVDPTGNACVGFAYINKPWIRVEELTLEQLIDTTKSSERFGDIQAGLMHLLGDRAVDAVTKTCYVENKRLYTNDSDAKAEFAILTNRALGRYLYTEGDDRSFGALQEIEKQPKIITTSLSVMDDTIVMVPASTAAKGSFDPFAWGNCLSATTLVYDVELSADGGHKRHLQLQPFYEFTNNMPMAYKLKVKGLTEYLKSKAVYLTKEVVA